MKTGGRGIVDGDARHRLGGLLVVGQVALSLALVAAAGLLLGSFRKLTTLDPGFRRDGLLLVQMDFAKLKLADEEQRVAQSDLLGRLRGLPGVTSAAAAFITPISRMSWNELIDVPGYTPSGPSDAIAFFNQVSDGYFQTLGTSLLAGRDIAPAEGAHSPRVAIINQTMARKFFGAGDPLGKTFQTKLGDTASPPIEVVGVVADAKYRSLDEQTLPTAYLPFGQGDGAGSELSYALRTAGAPAALAGAVKALATEVSPSLSLELTTMKEQISASLVRPRLLASLSAFFGGLALLLAVVGLYGTMSYNVTRRRNEIGIRIALGDGRRPPPLLARRPPRSDGSPARGLRQLSRECHLFFTAQHYE